jgi:hemolysin activation/secretion protein
LPANFSWHLTASLQVASGNLLGSEQLALTGTYGVRGYGENDSFADRGYMIRNELLLPVVNAASLFARLQPLVFYDYAQGSNKRLLPGERGRPRWPHVIGPLLRASLRLRLADSRAVRRGTRRPGARGHHV